jgi:hypothetical protein
MELYLAKADLPTCCEARQSPKISTFLGVSAHFIDSGSFQYSNLQYLPLVWSNFRWVASAPSEFRNPG